MASLDAAPTSTSADDRPLGGLLRFFRNFWETARVFLVSLAIIVPIRAYVVQPFFVRGASMAPSFQNGEYLIIDELSYDLGLRPLQRGDVVVARYPLDHSQYYIKRIIGLPGERVHIANGTITVFGPWYPQGVALDETGYLPAGETTDGLLDVTLRAGEVFVLGDNRDHSSDSRAWGPLPLELIVGRAWVRAFPVPRAGVVETPWYGGLAAPAATGR